MVSTRSASSPFLLFLPMPIAGVCCSCSWLDSGHKAGNRNDEGYRCQMPCCHCMVHSATRAVGPMATAIATDTIYKNHSVNHGRFSSVPTAPTTGRQGFPYALHTPSSMPKPWPCALRCCTLAHCCASMSVLLVPVWYQPSSTISVVHITE